MMDTYENVSGSARRASECRVGNAPLRATAAEQFRAHGAPCREAESPFAGHSLKPALSFRPHIRPAVERANSSNRSPQDRQSIFKEQA